MTNEQATADAARELVLSRAQTTSFVRFVTLLSRLVPHAAPLGADGPFEAEPLRLRHDPSLAFSSSDVAATREVATTRAWGEEERAPRLEVTTTFLGLSGSASPLPLHLVEEVAQEDPEHAPRRDFLDLFHHRILSLLYRGLTRFDVPGAFRSDGTDEHARRLLALAGIDTFDSPVDAELLRVVPALAGGRGTAHAIEAAIEAFFDERLEHGAVKVVPFVGGLERFEDDQRMRLGIRSSTLGVDAVLGRDAPHPASGIRIVIGPLGLDVYRGFLPDGDAHERLLAVIALALDAPLDVELELVLREGERPPFVLAGAAVLGRDTFLGGGGGRASVRVRRRTEGARAASSDSHPTN